MVVRPTLWTREPLGYFMYVDMAPKEDREYNNLLLCSDLLYHETFDEIQTHCVEYLAINAT